MNRGVTYSRPLAAGATAAAAIAGLLLCMRLSTDAQLSVLRSKAAAADASASVRIQGLSRFSQGNLDALRRRVGSFRVRLGADDTLEKVTRRLGGDWVADPESREERDGYSLVSVTFRVLAHSVSEWPEIVRTVQDLETTPGVGIAAFEMRTSGAGGRRILESASMTVVVRSARVVSNLQQHHED